MSLLSQASLVVVPSGYKEDVVYSVKPTDGSGDLTFSRASDGTRVNSQGLVERVPWNLATYSEQFDNAAWTANENTITANSTTSPTGLNNADSLTPNTNNTTHFITANQSISFTSGNNYTLSVYAKANGYNFLRLAFSPDFSPSNNRGASFDISNGTVGQTQSGVTAQIESLGNGWHRCSISRSATATIVSSGPFYINSQNADSATSVTFAGDGTSGAYIWGAQLNEGSTAKPYFPTTDRLNVPRLDYSGGCPSLLLEPQRTNVVTYSEQFDNAAWTKGGYGVGVTPVVTANDAISPDGYQNADKIDLSLGGGTTTSDLSWVFQTYSVTANQPQAISIYLKAATAGDVGKVIQVGLISYVTHTLTADWTRVELNQIIGSTTSYSIGFRLRGGQGTASTASLYAWGAQLEQNASYSTSYIPTTSASVTRVADAAYKTGISSLIGQTEGAMFVEFVNDANNNSSIDRIISVSDGTANNRMYVARLSSGASYFASVTSGTQTGEIFGTTMPQGVVKIAFAYKNNDVAMYVNGSLIGTDTSHTTPATSNLYLGQENAGTTNNLYKPYNQAVLFKTRLTNAELAALTTL